MQSQRTNQKPYQVLVEYMERHGDLCKISASSQNRYDNFTKWTELTNILNSTFPEGARSCGRWKRAWSDYKNNVKKKAKHIQENNRGTLTELEERLLKIVENQEQKNDYTRTTDKQYVMMVEFMERNGDIMTKYSEALEQEEKWAELTELLNSASPESPKSDTKWKRVWKYIKSYTKKKADKIEATKVADTELYGTTVRLTDLDQRILRIIRPGETDSLHDDIISQAWASLKKAPNTEASVSGLTTADFQRSILQMTETQPGVDSDSSEPLFGNYVHVPPSQEQYNIMCDYMERHGDMRLDPGREGREEVRKKWEELTELLNSSPSGPKRSVVEWQKVWSCLKGNLKRKMKRIEIRKAANKKLNTPGMILSKLDQRVLKLTESWTKANKADREFHDNEDMSETSQHSNISEQAPKRNINKDVTKTKQSISCVTPIDPEQSIVQITGSQPNANVDLQQDSSEPSVGFSVNVPPTLKQYNIMCDYMERHGDMRLDTGRDRRDDIRKKWEELTELLNSLPSGPKRSVADWQKAWSCLKSNIKRKVKRIESNLEKRKAAYKKLDTPGMIVTKLDQRVLKICESWAKADNADRELHENEDMSETSQHSNISEPAPNKDVTKTKQSISCVTPIDPEQSIIQITGTQPSADVDLQQDSLETSQHSNNSEQAPKRNINKDVAKTKQSISCVTPIDPEQSIIQIAGTQPSADVDLQQDSLEQSHDYKRTTHKQYVMMVEFMERYGDLLNNSEGRQARLEQKEKWAELTQLLNSASPESAKSDTKWKRVWKYIKYYTIKKANKIDATKGATVRLTDLEQIILRIAKACDGLLHEDNISEAWASSKNADFQQSVLQMTETQPGVDSDQDSSGPSGGFYAKEPPSHEQYNIMCDYMERHGDMKLDSRREGWEEHYKRWAELTELLNTSRSGRKRSAVEWKKVWKRLKSQLKRKIKRIELRKAANKKLNTPGMILSKLDQRVLKICESSTKADNADRQLHDNEDMSETSQHSNISEQAPKRNINKDVTKTKQSISCVTPIDPEHSIVQITGTQPSANVNLQQDSLEIKPVIETLTDEVMSDHEDTSGAIPVVKVEIGPVCHGCLITDRTLLPLGSYRDKFVLLIQNQSLYHNDTEPLLCCECLEMLKKFDKFQEQLINSQIILKQMNQRDSNWSSISQLQTNTKEYCDKAIEHAKTFESPALEDALEDALKHNDVYIKEEDSTTDYLQEDMHIEEPLDVKYLIKEIMNPKNGDSEPHVHSIIDDSNEVTNEIHYLQDSIDSTQDETNKFEMNLKHSDLKLDDGDSLMNDPSHIKDYVIEIIEDDIMDVSEDEIQISNINEKGNEIDTIDLSRDAIEISNINEKGNEINSKEGSSYSKSVGNDTIKQSYRASVKSKRINTSYHPYMDDYVHAKRIRDVDACNEIIRKKFSVHFLNENEMEAFAQRWNTTESQRESFECDPCNKIFVTMKDLLRHKDLNHHNPEDPYVCSFCNHNFSTFDDLKEHWLSHSAVVKCNVCQRIYRDDYIKKNGHTHNIIHECRYCDSYFAEIRVFSRHYREKHARYICDHCQNIYRNKKLLIQHICKDHKTATPFKCLPCKKSFFSQNLYDQHWKLYHEPSKPEDRFCEECGKLFDTIKLYQRHLDNTFKHKKRFRTKTVECPECGILIREKILANHMKKYHPDPKLKKFQCKICGVYLDKEKGLQYHLNTVHFVTKLRRNVCDVCGERFYNEHALRRHRLRHTGERPHGCAHCRKHFLYKTALIKHLRVRHGFN